MYSIDHDEHEKAIEYITTQQDYYNLEYGTLLHSYCTGTYTEVVLLL